MVKVLSGEEKVKAAIARGDPFTGPTPGSLEDASSLKTALLEAQAVIAKQEDRLQELTQKLLDVQAAEEERRAAPTPPER